MNENHTGYILLSSGVYSDYQNTAYRILKPFSFKETKEIFKKQWVRPKYWYRDTPGISHYISWLNVQGYIEDATEIQEIHVGGYDFDDNEYGQSEELLTTVFYPKDYDPS